MHIRLKGLRLQCRKGQEFVDLTSQITFLHGQMSTGKSSVLRLIDFCLGDREFRPTTAMQQELLSAVLDVGIGDYNVLIERRLTDRGSVWVTGADDEGDGATLEVPLDARGTAIWEDAVYNLSDLLYYLAGTPAPRIRRSASDEESPFIRLGFRDLLRYCYLEQNEMVSSFFDLHTPVIEGKSRAAMRFVLGYYSDRLYRLEAELQDAQEKRRAQCAAAEQLEHFLEEQGGSGPMELGEEVKSTEADLQRADAELQALRSTHRSATHFADELRQQLRNLTQQVRREEEALSDVGERIDQEEALKAELVSAKFKLARSRVASEILEGVRFEACPACGKLLAGGSDPAASMCYLCRQEPEMSNRERPSHDLAADPDLDDRIGDLSESIAAHTDAQQQQQLLVEQLYRRKQELDAELTEQLTEYDSSFLSSGRRLEREAATLLERLNHLQTLVEWHSAIGAMRTEADDLLSDEARLKRLISDEKASLITADQRVVELERAYAELLLDVDLPDFSILDSVEISRSTWRPTISHTGEADVSYTYESAGSGGKMTLLKVCYALALHRVAADNRLPLPPFLIIDTPMSNIDHVVDRSIFVAF